VGLLGVYWAVHAQEGRPLFAPPPVLPTDDAKKPAAKPPQPAPPVRGKAKADPSLIIPAEVYDVPRPLQLEKEAQRVGFVTEEKSGILQAGGVALPPMFPPAPTAPEPKVEKGPSVPPPLPAIETSPLAPILDPAKALIVEPGVKEPAPKKASPTPALPLPPPLMEMPETKPATPMLPPEVAPAPLLNPDAKPAPVLPAPMGIPVNKPAPMAPATIRMPTATEPAPEPAPQPAQKPRAFVRIHSAANETPRPPEPAPIAPEPDRAVSQIQKIVVPPLNVPAATTTTTPQITLRPQNDVVTSRGMTIQLTGPAQVAVGKPAVFEIRVANQTSQPLTGIVLHGLLPEGLNTFQGRKIEGEVDASIAPGEVKTLKMPTSAVKPGRHTLAVKVTTFGGNEASATAVIDIGTDTLQLQQAPTTRLLMGRDGDLRIEVTNHTGRALRNVTVADRLPEGLDFIGASDRGLYQANSRTVYWLLDLPAGKTQALILRVNGTKAGPLENKVFAKADSVPELQSTGIVALEGIADLTLRVVDRDFLIELGKENVYEIRVQNPGNASASSVQLQVQFPPGLLPKSAQGNTKFSMDRQSVVFEPIASLEPQGQAIFRVSAVAQSMGDQRVRFAVASEQVRTPVQREISTRVVER
jgi:uncharacterized repeat protein (TIGR01451 family)